MLAEKDEELRRMQEMLAQMQALQVQMEEVQSQRELNNLRFSVVELKAAAPALEQLTTPPPSEVVHVAWKGTRVRMLSIIHTYIHTYIRRLPCK